MHNQAVLGNVFGGTSCFIIYIQNVWLSSGPQKQAAVRCCWYWALGRLWGSPITRLVGSGECEQLLWGRTWETFGEGRVQADETVVDGEYGKGESSSRRPLGCVLWAKLEIQQKDLAPKLIESSSSRCREKTVTSLSDLKEGARASPGPSCPSFSSLGSDHVSGML